MKSNMGLFANASFNASVFALVLVLATTLPNSANSAPILKQAMVVPSQNILQNSPPTLCEGPKCPPQFTQIPPQITESLGTPCEGPKCPPIFDFPSRTPSTIGESPRSPLKVQHPPSTIDKNGNTCIGPKCPPNSPTEKKSIPCEGPKCTPAFEIPHSPTEKKSIPCEGPKCPYPTFEIPHSPTERKSIPCEGPKCPPVSKNVIDQNTPKSNIPFQTPPQLASSVSDQLNAGIAPFSNTPVLNGAPSQPQLQIPVSPVSKESVSALSPLAPAFVPNQIPIQRPSVQIPQPNISPSIFTPIPIQRPIEQNERPISPPAFVSKELPIQRPSVQLPRVSPPSTKSGSSSGSDPLTRENLERHTASYGRKKAKCIPGTKKSDPRNHRQNDEDFVDIDRAEQMIAKKPARIMKGASKHE